ncbi:MAG: phasin family protein [Proteobacteria bacterium]|nr:phasin family protein [Pseudomonadota bacterium]
MAKAENKAAETAETMAAAGKETFETVLNLSAEAASEGYKTFATAGKEQLETAKAGYDKFVAQSKEGIDAVSAATAASLAGAEAVFDEVSAYTKTATAENVEVVQKAFAAKTPQEFFEIQMEVFNNSFNRVVAQSTKMNEIVADAATKSFEPIKAQMEKSTEAFVKPFVA